MTVFTHEPPPDIYRGFERVLIAQNRIDNALEVAEQGRSRALGNLFVTRLATELKFVSTSVSPSIEQIKEIAKKQNSTLVHYSVLYDANQMYQFSRFRLSFDNPYAYAETLLIWVVQPTGKIAFRQVNLKRLWQHKNIFLASLVRSLCESLDAEERNTSDRLLQQLYQLLIEPIAELLPEDSNSRVTFIPQDFLFLVPFAALQDDGGTYLIEKHTILTAPSIQALELTHRNKMRRCRAAAEIAPAVRFSSPHALRHISLIVGNPAMPSLFLNVDEPPLPLASLPAAELEAERVAELLGTAALIGTQATKEAVMQQITEARFIHLATRALLDDIDGLVGAIALAPSAEDDGFLTIPEIIDLKLNAELVVLSGCDTSRGRIWGDGVAALSHAFIAAGVSSIILSLWCNPDAPTAFLMKEFYQNLQRTDDNARSLRNAMLATLQQYPHPRDWAAFTLVGEALTVNL